MFNLIIVTVVVEKLVSRLRSLVNPITYKMATRCSSSSRELVGTYISPGHVSLTMLFTRHMVQWNREILISQLGHLPWRAVVVVRAVCVCVEYPRSECYIWYLYIERAERPYDYMNQKTRSLHLIKYSSRVNLDWRNSMNGCVRASSRNFQPTCLTSAVVSIPPNVTHSHPIGLSQWKSSVLVAKPRSHRLIWSLAVGEI